MYFLSILKCSGNPDFNSFKASVETTYFQQTHKFSMLGKGGDGERCFAVTLVSSVDG